MLTEQENLENMILTIKEKLGIEVDRNSFDYEILETINKFSSYIDNQNLEFLNAHTFENLKSKNLDNFLNFFNMYRTKGNNSDIYEFEFLYNSFQENISISYNAIFKYNNELYKNIRATIVNNERTILYAQKIFTIEEILLPVFSMNGVVMFSKNDIKISDEKLDVLVELPKKLNLISFSIKENEVESDFDYLEKSKNILQSFGYSNLKKIELTLLQDTRIKSVFIDDNNGYTNITIFPKELSELDNIIKYNQHVVDYYKSSNIVLLKPNIAEISILGLQTQIILRDDYTTLNSLVLDKLNLVLNHLYAEDGEVTIDSSELVYHIKSVFDNYYDKNILIDYNRLSVQMNYFFKENYNIPIIVEEIYNKKTIKSTDVLTIGQIR